MVEGEAAADVLTGAVAARAVEPESGKVPSASAVPRSACLNCGAGLIDAYCASCGQSAHIHRTFQSLGHDVLHSVFHFEGKFWRTMPELVFRPGRLTRRYIDGERAKFISPMALFLFTVFVMYGVFAFMPELDWEDPPPLPGAPAIPRFEISGLEDAEPSVPGTASRAARASAEEPTADDRPDAEPTNPFGRAVQKLEENPDLVFYKMKSNGYKWSWLLVPLSIPFIWLLFAWRREFSLYDHAVFVTYSISFMMMLLVVSTLAQVAGASGRVQAALLMLVPALHLYKQLRGTYALSRAGALVRLVFVLASAAIVLSFFLTMLLLTGALE